MPQCYIDDTYMDECIIDPRDGKLRHCSTCEAVIQDLRDDYEKLDNRKKPRRGNRFETAQIDDEWDALAEELLVEPVTLPHHFLAEEYEPTD